MNNVEKYLSNLFVISLKKRLDRRERMKKELDSLNLTFNFFDAVSDKTNNRFACSLSHIKVLKNFVLNENSGDYLTVLEDDCVFANNFIYKFNALPLSKYSWDFFKMGCLHVEAPVLKDRTLYTATKCLDTHATIYTREGAKKTADIIFNGVQLDDKEACDVMVLKSMHELSVLSVYPNLAWQLKGLSSITNEVYSNYNEDGTQQWFKSAIADL